MSPPSRASIRPTLHFPSWLWKRPKNNLPIRRALLRDGLGFRVGKRQVSLRAVFSHRPTALRSISFLICKQPRRNSDFSACWAEVAFAPSTPWHSPAGSRITQPTPLDFVSFQCLLGSTDKTTYQFAGPSLATLLGVSPWKTGKYPSVAPRKATCGYRAAA